MRRIAIAACICLTGCGSAIETRTEPERANLCLEPFPECEPWDVTALLGRSYPSALRVIRGHASSAYILSVDGMRRAYPLGNVPWRVDLTIANNTVVGVGAG
jgi:hypothetical protein